MTEQDRNTCVICLDSLPSAPMGACVPCGHCFHSNCYDKWAAACRRRRDVKCPTCNEVGDFVKLYLDLGDDDVSLSSDDESDMENDDDQEANESTTEDSETRDDDHDDQEESRDSSNAEEAKSDDHLGLIVIDDEDDTTSSENTKQEERKSNLTDDAQKYRKKAKNLKKRVRMLESQHNKQTQEHKELLTKHSRMRSQVKELEKELDEVIRESEHNKRQLEGVHLKLVRLQREKDALASELSAKTEQASKAESTLHQAKLQHRRDLERAQAKSLAEVKHILEEFPTLKQENRTLKEDLMRKDDQISKLQRQLESQSKTTVQACVDRELLKENTVKSINRTTKKVEMLREMDEGIQRDKMKSVRVKKAEQVEALSRMQPKISAHAARFSRATDKSSSRSGIDALDAIDQELHVDTNLITKPISLGQFTKRPHGELRRNDSLERSIRGAKRKQPKIRTSMPKKKAKKPPPDIRRSIFQSQW